MVAAARELTRQFAIERGGGEDPGAAAVNRRIGQAVVERQAGFERELQVVTAFFAGGAEVAETAHRAQTKVDVFAVAEARHDFGFALHAEAGVIQQLVGLHGRFGAEGGEEQRGSKRGSKHKGVPK